ncbi:hypothetical protein SAMN04515671_0705 [Nakamurella panacisegetis]|uniref:Uncharacterized protein n=1 Tax=Nakamurella panacisegetis TaxID=1090615 RepID=A0A1H0IYP7_9ACTN|nr:hypothetical protein SAMN04515671_0705 [Nakamurella panacisegetis]
MINLNTVTNSSAAAEGVKSRSMVRPHRGTSCLTPKPSVITHVPAVESLIPYRVGASTARTVDATLRVVGSPVR